MSEAIIMLATDERKGDVIALLVKALDDAPEIGPPSDYLPEKETDDELDEERDEPRVAREGDPGRSSGKSKRIRKSS